MFTINATDARKEWSLVIDNVVREKPQFITRTRDCMVLSDIKLFENLLSAYEFTAYTYKEDDHSITISLNEIDLAENAETIDKAKMKLAEAIIEYAEDFYSDFKYWSTAPNRAAYIPYVFKALIINDSRKIGDLIKCQKSIQRE